MTRPRSRLTAAAALLAACLAAPPALAQDISGSATLGYTRLSVDGLDRPVSIGTLDAALDVDARNGLTFGSTLSFQNLGVEGGDDFQTRTSRCRGATGSRAV